MAEKKLISVKTLKNIAESPEEFARLFLENCGTDALEDFMDRMFDTWSNEGCHK